MEALKTPPGQFLSYVHDRPETEFLHPRLVALPAPHRRSQHRVQLVVASAQVVDNGMVGVVDTGVPEVTEVKSVPQFCVHRVDRPVVETELVPELFHPLEETSPLSSPTTPTKEMVVERSRHLVIVRHQGSVEDLQTTLDSPVSEVQVSTRHPRDPVEPGVLP